MYCYSSRQVQTLPQPFTLFVMFPNFKQIGIIALMKKEFPSLYQFKCHTVVKNNDSDNAKAMIYIFIIRFFSASQFDYGVIYYYQDKWRLNQSIVKLQNNLASFISASSSKKMLSSTFQSIKDYLSFKYLNQKIL